MESESRALVSMILESGTGNKRVQIYKSIGDDFHYFPSIDVHRPIVASLQSSKTVIVGHSKRHQEQAHEQKQLGEQSRTASTHEQLGEQAKQAKHVVDLKSVESEQARHIVDLKSVESQVSSRSKAVGGKAICDNAMTDN